MISTNTVEGCYSIFKRGMKSVYQHCAVPNARAQTQSAAQTVPVNPSNFVRAETDLYFISFAKAGAFGKFAHIREPAEIDDQIVVRSIGRVRKFSMATGNSRSRKQWIKQPRESILRRVPNPQVDWVASCRLWA